MTVSESTIRQQMKDRVATAYHALSSYKFWMFGYHAAAWVNLNRLLTEKQPNPFRCLVAAARQSSEGRAISREESVDISRQIIERAERERSDDA